MFRSLFRSLTPSRPQTRSQVQTFRPRLEVLEDRLAPSGFHLNNVAFQIDSHSSHIFQDGSHNFAGQIDSSHSTIVQVGNHDVALQIDSSHSTIVQVP